MIHGILIMGGALVVGAAAAYAARNALLAWRRPAIEALLRRSTGQDLTLGFLELDSGFSTLTAGATVVLKPGLTLELDRVVLTRLTGLLKRDDPIRSLGSASGRLVYEQDGIVLRLPFRFQPKDAAGGALEGTLTVTGGHVHYPSNCLNITFELEADLTVPLAASGDPSGSTCKALLRLEPDAGSALLQGKTELTVDVKQGAGRWQVALSAAALRLKAAAELALTPVKATLSWEPGQEMPQLDEIEATLAVTSDTGVLSGALVSRRRDVPAAGHWVRQSLTFQDAKLEPSGPPGGPLSGIAVRCDLDLRPGAWQVADLQLAWNEATLAGTATGLFDGSLLSPTSLRVEGLEADALVALLHHLPGLGSVRVARSGNGSGGIPLPPDLRTTAVVNAVAAGLEVTITFDTDSSRLFLTRPAGSSSGKLSGRLSSRDINVMEWFAPVRFADGEEVHLDLAVRSGPALTLSGPATSAALTVKAMGSQAITPVPFTDLRAQLQISGVELKWEAFGRVVGGEATGAGRMDFATDPFPYDARLTWSGLNTRQTPLGSQIAATASGKMMLAGRGTSTATLTGQGELSLEEPNYLLLKDIGASMASYGLPPPPLRGSGTARCSLSLGDNRVRAEGLDLRVPGVRLDGDVGVGFDGSLLGTVNIELEQQYLLKSPVLSLAGSVTKSVRVPVPLSGTLQKPQYSIELGSTLGHLMKNYKLGDITQGLAKNYEFGSFTRGLMDVFGGKKPSKGTIRPGPELDRVFAHILANGPDASKLIEELSAAGLSPEDLRNYLADYRQRSGGRGQ